MANLKPLQQGRFMNLASIISTLQSEREEIDQAIVSFEESHRPNSQATKGAAQSVAKRPRERHTKIISELRLLCLKTSLERDHIENAILALERFDRHGVEKTQRATS
jgi:hypothetical protein